MTQIKLPGFFLIIIITMSGCTQKKNKDLFMVKDHFIPVQKIQFVFLSPKYFNHE